jgi:hypothetical protein
MPQPPFHTLSFGVIRAAIWRNENEDPSKGPRYNVTFERGYKDDNGKWTSTESFGRDDLLTLCELAREAFTFIHSHQEVERERARAHNAKPEAANQNGR